LFIKHKTIAGGIMKFLGRPCPTVTIVTEAGPCVINKSDYDAKPDDYELFEATDSSEVEKTDTPEKKDETTETSLKRRTKKRVKPDGN
jgi:hypothetical protein